MKRYLPLLAVILLSPMVDAAPASVQVDQETDTLQQLLDGIHVNETLAFHPVAAAQYQSNALWTLLLQHSASSLTVHAGRNGNDTLVPGTRVTREPDAGDATYDRLTVNLTGLFAGVVSSDRLTLRLDYQVGNTYHHTLTSAPATLLVYAEPRDGFTSKSDELPAFFPTGTRDHSALQQPPSGFHYAFTFERATAPTGGGQARDLTPYLWLVGGLVIGFLIAAFLARRGTFGTAAKKFEKGGAMESRDMLEARRRTLMAALKDLELAHEAKEIPDAAYAPLKEEYKAQTVRVMRRLEEKQEAPKP